MHIANSWRVIWSDHVPRLTLYSVYIYYKAIVLFIILNLSYLIIINAVGILKLWFSFMNRMLLFIYNIQCYAYYRIKHSVEKGPIRSFPQQEVTSTWRPMNYVPTIIQINWIYQLINNLVDSPINQNDLNFIGISWITFTHPIPLFHSGLTSYYSTYLVHMLCCAC